MSALQVLQITGWVELALLVMLLACAPEMLWVHYLAVMNLARVKRTELGLTKWSTAVGTYVLLRGYFLDFLCNMIHMTLLLREWPLIPWAEMFRGLAAVRSVAQFKDWLHVTLKYEWIVTARLTRHIDGPDGRNKDYCLYIRTEFLDRFDTKRPDGIHR